MTDDKALPFHELPPVFRDRSIPLGPDGEVTIAEADMPVAELSGVYPPAEAEQV